MKEMNRIETYGAIVKLRDQLKRVQQLSWNITQFEKKFPFDQMTEDQYEDLFRAYSEYAMDMFVINKVFGSILKEAQKKGIVPKA